MVKPSKWIVALIASGVLGVVPATGQEELHQHDHAEAGALGVVDFPISCHEVAKPDFDKGIALLHSFGYDLARKAFRNAAADSERCGIAWWGVAMTYYHPLWAPPTQEEASAGADAASRAKAAGAATERERAYIDAIGVFYDNIFSTSHASRAAAYRDQMEALAKRFPDDPEARIFLALALLGTASPEDATFAQQRRAGEILNAELAKQPKHPGIVHYIIHSFDYPELADLALPAARVYAQIAPASPHAQHMPSHIFTRLGLWQESIASNLASEASAYAIAKNQPGVVPSDAFHALDYLEYAYLQTGQIEEAKEAMARAVGGKAADSVFQAGYSLAAIPARFALERRAWT